MSKSVGDDFRRSHLFTCLQQRLRFLYDFSSVDLKEALLLCPGQSCVQWPSSGDFAVTTTFISCCLRTDSSEARSGLLRFCHSQG